MQGKFFGGDSCVCGEVGGGVGGGAYSGCSMAGVLYVVVALGRL
jgi:hypothetical protein